MRLVGKGLCLCGVVSLLMLMCMTVYAGVDTEAVYKRSEIIFLVDRSESMQDSDPDDDVLERIKTVADALDGEVSICVATYGDAFESMHLYSLYDENKAIVREEVDALKGIYESSTDVAEAFRAARSLTTQGENPVVVLITDGGITKKQPLEDFIAAREDIGCPVIYWHINLTGAKNSDYSQEFVQYISRESLYRLVVNKQKLDAVTDELIGFVHRDIEAIDIQLIDREGFLVSDVYPDTEYRLDIHIETAKTPVSDQVGTVEVEINHNIDKAQPVTDHDGLFLFPLSFSEIGTYTLTCSALHVSGERAIARVRIEVEPALSRGDGDQQNKQSAQTQPIEYATDQAKVPDETDTPLLLSLWNIAKRYLSLTAATIIFVFVLGRIKKRKAAPSSSSSSNATITCRFIDEFGKQSEAYTFSIGIPSRMSLAELLTTKKVAAYVFFDLENIILRMNKMPRLNIENNSKYSMMSGSTSLGKNFYLEQNTDIILYVSGEPNAITVVLTWQCAGEQNKG